MAVAKMEKLALTFREEHLDEVLQLMQGFQGIHIETGFESSIPPARKSTPLLNPIKAGTRADVASPPKKP